MSLPYTFDEAKDLVKGAQAAQKATEDLLRTTSVRAAEAERAYRTALAKEIVRQHAEDGAAWTVCQDLARGNPEVASRRMERDIAQGVREASQQQAWRASADRKDLTQLVLWSMRRELAEGYEPPTEASP